MSLIASHDANHWTGHSQVAPKMLELNAQVSGGAAAQSLQRRHSGDFIRFHVHALRRVSPAVSKSLVRDLVPLQSRKPDFMIFDDCKPLLQTP